MVIFHFMWSFAHVKNKKKLSAVERILRWRISLKISDNENVCNDSLPLVDVMMKLFYYCCAEVQRLILCGDPLHCSWKCQFISKMRSLIDKEAHETFCKFHDDEWLIVEEFLRICVRVIFFPRMCGNLCYFHTNWFIVTRNYFTTPFLCLACEFLTNISQ